jgi:hypothetical protein
MNPLTEIRVKWWIVDCRRRRGVRWRKAFLIHRRPAGAVDACVPGFTGARGGMVHRSRHEWRH